MYNPFGESVAHPVNDPANDMERLKSLLEDPLEIAVNPLSVVRKTAAPLAAAGLVWLEVTIIFRKLIKAY